MQPPHSVTVIVPTFNRAALLGRALRSVAAQTLPPYEVIVADDGSTDDTRHRLSAYQPELQRAGIPLSYSWRPNRGAAAARNRGLALAAGEYVCFLDSDDSWRPHIIATLSQLLDENPSAALAFCASDTVDESGRIVARRDDGMAGEPPHGLLRRPEARIIRHMPLVTPAVMIRRDVLERLGGFDETFRVGEDWDLWYRIARGYDFAYTRDALACCLQHDGNTIHASAAALADKVRLNLKHLTRVREPAARQVLLHRMAKYSVLLQEQMLREAMPDDRRLAELLTNPLLPKTWRFKLGASFRDRPRWIGQTYAALIRAAGHTRRAAAIV